MVMVAVAVIFEVTVLYTSPNMKKKPLFFHSLLWCMVLTMFLLVHVPWLPK